MECLRLWLKGQQGAVVHVRLSQGVRIGIARRLYEIQPAANGAASDQRTHGHDRGRRLSTSLAAAFITRCNGCSVTVDCENTPVPSAQHGRALTARRQKGRPVHARRSTTESLLLRPRCINLPHVIGLNGWLCRTT
jgi:hypothetical protein